MTHGAHDIALAEEINDCLAFGAIVYNGRLVKLPVRDLEFGGKLAG